MPCWFAAKLVTAGRASMLTQAFLSQIVARMLTQAFLSQIVARLFLSLLSMALTAPSRHDKQGSNETTLSNLPCYAEHGFGVEPFNATLFNKWVMEGKAPALPESLKPYRKLLSLVIKAVFITGRAEDQRSATATNLSNVGYHIWERLILKEPSYLGKPSVEYKSNERKKLEKNGYSIIGNIESYLMNGGNGYYSYTKNSHYQKTGINVVNGMVSEEIGEKLDINNFSSSSNSFRLADLGCSVGPNTFPAMQNILDVVQHKYQSKGLASKIPEFQVFFNDQDSNDFNTLFTSMAKERQYYAAGVQWSFYDRLFPQSFLHFVNSSFAFHWLSRVPEELLDKNSPAWNKGRIHYTNASDAVVDAYAAQFTKDMEAGVMFDCLGSCLNDMAKEGLLSEDQVDSFNIPIYAPSPMEITELVERNGCFSIERLELTNFQTEDDAKVDVRACVMHIRAGFEWIISKNFGNDIIDDLFNRLLKKVKESFHLVQSSYKGGTQLSVVLKRK
ncbi:hypothetical protein CRYUN_Cryun21dG0030300 [Craigia yunnanensis]